MFTNVYTVTEADSIEKLDVIDLYRQKVERENAALDDDIQTIQGENAGYARTQSDILARVAELRKNEQYLTDSRITAKRSASHSG